MNQLPYYYIDWKHVNSYLWNYGNTARNVDEVNQMLAHLEAVWGLESGGTFLFKLRKCDEPVL